jgi:uncharacterized protein (UPF0147 family)
MLKRISNAIRIAGILALCLTAGGILAQEYEQQPLAQDQTGKLVRSWTLLRSTNESKAIVDMLTSNSSVDNAAIDKFFTTMVFPLFTQSKDVVERGKTYSPLIDSPSNYSPSKMRTAFKTDYAGKAQNPAVHEHLNQLAMAAMEKIANGNYHPVCRANAIILIGDLNETDPNGPPYKKAFAALLNAAAAANSIPQVRIPSLRGLERQAIAGIDAENRAQLITAMLAILKQHAVPAGRGAIDHDWTCRRAIDVLAAVGEPGSGGAVVTGLLAVINDNATPLPIRCAAAAALPAVKFNPQQAGDAAQFVKTLGKLAVEEYKSQLTAAKACNSKIPAEEIKKHLSQIRLGLNTMTSAASVSQSVNQLLGQIDNLSRACDTKPAEPPASTGLGTVGAGPTIPTDTQAPIAKAIAAAGESLENTLVGDGNGTATGSPFP